jgi:hypothetical protein
MNAEVQYVEGKLNRALKLLSDKPADAAAQLQLAQAKGLDFVVNKQDDPLVAAQMALQLAERMAEEGREEAAKANLQFTKNYLEGSNEDVAKLQDEISKLQGQVGQKGTPKTIRGLWDRVANWFVRKPGEMHTTSKAAEIAQPEKR